MPLLHTLVPWLSASALEGLHAAVRKLAHFVEYAILALLWLRAFRFRSRLDLRQASWAALAMCLACAIVDEVHQARVPGRHGTVEDVVLDTLGAAAALMIVRARRQAPDASQPSGSPTTGGPVRLDERA
jgi:VanZ family protein